MNKAQPESADGHLRPEYTWDRGSPRAIASSLCRRHRSCHANPGLLLPMTPILALNRMLIAWIWVEVPDCANTSTKCLNCGYGPVS